jgi:hypothetical protein
MAETIFRSGGLIFKDDIVTLFKNRGLGVQSFAAFLEDVGGEDELAEGVLVDDVFAWLAG